MRQIQIQKGYAKNGKRVASRRDADLIRQEFYDPEIRKAKKAGRKS